MPCPIATHAHHVRFELKLDAACIETTQLATFCNVTNFQSTSNVTEISNCVPCAPSERGAHGTQREMAAMAIGVHTTHHNKLRKSSTEYTIILRCIRVIPWRLNARKLDYIHAHRICML